MPLVPGTRLGPYEIIATAGAGGMGEVYRARDTRLGREVAIKVLPEHLSADPGRRERFEREARAVSALNHPNICTLFDIGSQETAQGPVAYLVLEHLEGETVADRLARGPLPIDQVLRHAAEIADGLGRAHRLGIIHRDLKPANVMLTKTGAKLLDFGLAKYREGDGAAAGPAPGTGTAGAAPVKSMLPTATRELTTAGTLLGTFQYMAPEQLEGNEADARTDIFAFGALLYEMTTGRRAFEGGSQASLIAAIMGKEPPAMATLAPLSPPALERIVRRCLAKDPDDRWQSAGDLAHELRFLSGGAAATASGVLSAPSGEHAAAVAAAAGAARARPGKGIGPVLAAALVVVAAAVAGVAGWRLRPEPPSEVLRASLNMPSDLRLDSQNMPLAFSPDGRTLAFAAGAGGKRMIYLRPLDSLEAHALAGTEGATYPFWSPDGRFLGFFAERKLKKVPAAGGTVVSLCDAMDGRGASWGRTGQIAFSPGPFGGIMLVPEAGGAATALTSTTDATMTHRLPFFLPDGRHLLYFAGTATRDEHNGIRWVDIESKKTGDVITVQSGARYSEPGWLTFVRDNNLMAQRFDPGTLKISGEAFPIAERVRFVPPRWSATYAVSDQGALVYQTGSAAQRAQLTWFDLEGRKSGTIAEPMPVFGLAIAPDGGRAVVGRVGTDGITQLWMYDLARGLGGRFTFGSDAAMVPVWSPDSRRVAYTDGEGRVLVKSADGVGEPEAIVAQRDAIRTPIDWSPDGSSILLRTQTPTTGVDIQRVAAGGDHAIGDVIVAPANQPLARFSPDGRWIAYLSDESGDQAQLFIVPARSTGGKWQVTSGGAGPFRWMPDGRRVVYETSDNKLMAVDITVQGQNLEIGAPVPFFGGQPAPDTWTIAPDGKRILGSVVVEEGPTAPLALVTHWTKALERP
jgi:eukaryotic-like serine/threonine-protein kinase